jgi:hypothetical protein
MTQKQYKQTVDEFLTNRYDFLLECAKNITFKMKTDPCELVSELAIFLYANKEKLDPYMDGKMLEGFSVSWLKIQGRHKTSPFNRKCLYQNDKMTDQIPEQEDQIQSTETEDPYITDLRNIYTDDQINNILKIHDIFPTLHPSHQILFKAYFLEDLTYDRIKDKYTFYKIINGKKINYKSKYSIHKMMVGLKEEIKKKL